MGLRGGESHLSLCHIIKAATSNDPSQAKETSRCCAISRETAIQERIVTPLNPAKWRDGVQGFHQWLRTLDSGSRIRVRDPAWAGPE